tara:strand:- start:855 stop:1661 length:807 start_codon:yes stop_codon:yes gene_type:complete
MKKIDLGFIQGRLSRPPSKQILQYFPQKNWRNEFSLANKLRFCFIEYFAEREFNNKNPIWHRKSLNEISKLAKKNKLINYTFCDDFYINNNFVNYRDFNNYYNKIIENLSKIKIKIYVLALFEKSALRKNNLRKYVNRLKILSNYLKKKNIKLALETNLNSHLIKKLIRLTNSKNIFIVYDTGNRLKKSNLQYEEIIKLKKYICHFHLKDKNWKRENVVLGNGSVNFRNIFKAINKIKYKGKFTFETNRGKHPFITMKKNIEFIKNIS